MFTKFEVWTIKKATVRRNLAVALFLKNQLPLKILLLLQYLQRILQILHKHSQVNSKGPQEVGFLNLPREIFLNNQNSKFNRKIVL